MAAFGGNDLIALAVPNEERFAEAGARGEEGARAAGFGLAFIEHAKLFWIEILDAVAPCAEVIQQNNVGDIEFLGKNSGVDGPGEIRGADAIVDDGPAMPKPAARIFSPARCDAAWRANSLAMRSNCAKSLLRKRCLKTGVSLPSFFTEQREITFCTANIARKDQRYLLRTLNRIKSAKVALWVVPFSAVAFEQVVRFFRPPTAGSVFRNLCTLRGAPNVKDGIDQGPGRLDAVGTVKERCVAADAIVDERCVCAAR